MALNMTFCCQVILSMSRVRVPVSRCRSTGATNLQPQIDERLKLCWLKLVALHVLLMSLFLTSQVILSGHFEMCKVSVIRLMTSSLGYNLFDVINYTIPYPRECIQYNTRFSWAWTLHSYGMNSFQKNGLEITAPASLYDMNRSSTNLKPASARTSHF